MEWASRSERRWCGWIEPGSEESLAALILADPNLISGPACIGQLQDTWHRSTVAAQAYLRTKGKMSLYPQETSSNQKSTAVYPATDITTASLCDFVRIGCPTHTYDLGIAQYIFQNSRLCNLVIYGTVPDLQDSEIQHRIKQRFLY